METTNGYKYYLTRNEEGNKIKTIEILKIGENWREEITYIRLPGGGFNISRQLYPIIVEEEPRGREIEDYEFEVISRGCLDAADTFDRLLSYFEDEDRTQVHYLGGAYERMNVCYELGIPLLRINSPNIPTTLQDSIPYIQNGRVMVTQECIKYLITLKKILSEDIKNRNSIWMLQGVEELISQINDHYPNLQES